MKCVILQPSYIPWRGYFHQIEKADLFVFYDDVQYDDRGWRNRNRVKTEQGTRWLTIPVFSQGVQVTRTPIRDVRIAWERPWARKHWETIRHSYSRAPHFARYSPLLADFYSRRGDNLADFTIELTIALAWELGLTRTRFLRSSSLAVSGERTDRLLALLRRGGCRTTTSAGRRPAGTSRRTRSRRPGSPSSTWPTTTRSTSSSTPPTTRTCRSSISSSCREPRRGARLGPLREGRGAVTQRVAAPELSVVTMLYRSEPYLREFHRRARHGRGGPHPRVRDRLRGRRLAGRLGGARAGAGGRGLAGGRGRAVAQLRPPPGGGGGPAHARGRRVFILDVDLEEQPEWLAGFAAQMDASGADVVFGSSRVRKGTLLRRVLGGVFWKLFNALSDITVPENPCTVRLMSRRYVDALLTLPDRNLFLAGSYAWLGFRQEPRPVEKGLRKTASTYTAPPADRPVHRGGDVVHQLSPAADLRRRGRRGRRSPSSAARPWRSTSCSTRRAISLGWASIIVSIWFLGGVIISFLGVIGIYLAKIFNEAKGRPLYVVKSVSRAGGER